MTRSCLVSKYECKYFAPVEPVGELEPMPMAAEFTYRKDDESVPIPYSHDVSAERKAQLAASADYWKALGGTKRTLDEPFLTVKYDETVYTRIFNVYDPSTATLVEENEPTPDARTSEMRQAAAHLLHKTHDVLITYDRKTGKLTYNTAEDADLEAKIREHTAKYTDTMRTEVLLRAQEQITQELIPNFERQVPRMGRRKEILKVFTEAEADRERIKEYLDYYAELMVHPNKTLLRGVPVHGFHYNKLTESALHKTSRVLRGMVDMQANK